MNADDAKREAVMSLAARLRAWGIDEAHKVAENYISDMTRAGWIWMPPNNRPRPPRRDEACHVCGRHLDGCLCDQPTNRPPQPAANTTEQIARLRRQLNHREDA